MAGWIMILATLLEPADYPQLSPYTITMAT